MRTNDQGAWMIMLRAQCTPSKLEMHEGRHQRSRNACPTAWEKGTESTTRRIG